MFQMRRFRTFTAAYFRHRPITTTVFLVSVAAVAGLLPIAWRLYRDIPVHLPIEVSCHGARATLERIDVNVRRTGEKRDVILVRLSLADTVEKDDYIIVGLPDSFTYTGNEIIAGTWRTHSYKPKRDYVWYYLKPTAKNVYRTPSLEFAGPVFARHSLVNVRILIFAAFNGVVLDPPTVLTVGGLHDLTIDDVNPEPDEKKPGYVRWQAASWSDKTADQSVTIRGIDRVAASRDQFWLFMVATLIGVAVSIAAASVQTLLSEYERTHVAGSG